MKHGGDVTSFLVNTQESNRTTALIFLSHQNTLKEEDYEHQKSCQTSNSSNS